MVKGARALWITAALVTALAGMGCATRAAAQGETMKSFCSNGEQFRSGPYIYENNQWGRAKARGAFTQCLLQRGENGKAATGWQWDWPGFDPTVFAYPEIIYGWKPWSGGQSTDARLPMTISAIRRMSLRFDLDLAASGAWDIAPEIWLVTPGAGGTKRNPGAITTEVMFWMDKAEMQPAGTVIDSVSVAGATYDLWKLPHMGDRGDGTGWAYFAFESRTPQQAATIDIKAFLAFLVDRSHVSASDQVASIEFGTEVAGGKGTAWVRDYAIDIE
jgi:hypothetical protein